MHTRSQKTIIQIAELSSWQPQADDRILVFAPHPDDETLATGGVIASALARCNPEQVRVVVATNGDASRLAAMTASRRPPTRSQQLALARLRQQESLAALRILGMAPDNVQFWGYPDSGLQYIWRYTWDGRRFRSKVTGFESAEQAHNAPRSPYTATAILRQMMDLLDAFRPTVIFTSHPDDAHPDHAALAKFILLAARLAGKGVDSCCELFSYPMWLQARPLPRSIRFTRAAFNLPARFTHSAPEWVYFPLPDPVRQKKAQALHSYRSQFVTVRGLLKASARSSYEAFGRLHPSSAPLPPVPGISEATLRSTL
jgi:LmbE family N-acetylglucosaminyl deacetylase